MHGSQSPIDRRGVLEYRKEPKVCVVTWDGSGDGSSGAENLSLMSDQCSGKTLERQSPCGDRCPIRRLLLWQLSLPLTQVQCCPVQDVTVLGREALHRTQGQTTETDEEGVEEDHHRIIDYVFVHEPVGHESCVVPVDDGREHGLLEARVEVTAQAIDLGAYGTGLGGATVQWSAVEVLGVRLALVGGAEEGLYLYPEYDHVQDEAAGNGASGWRWSW